MGEIEVIDTHEHLPSEADRVASTPDFSLFFSHYCQADLISAGMAPADLARFYSPATPLDQKWQLFAPFYGPIQDGSYCRAAHLAMERFYQIPRLESLADAVTLTERLRAANEPGIYRKVLKETCHIRLSMNFGGLADDPEYFAPVLFMTQYVELTRDTIRGLEDALQVSCPDLRSFTAALEEQLRRHRQRGMKGLKLALAYERDLDFAPRTDDDAARVYNRLVEEHYGWRGQGLGYEECRPLQDYMVHWLVDIAGRLELPFVFHTGMQAHNGHRISDARPEPLWNIANRHRRTNIILLHAGFPWMDGVAAMCKHHRNIYLDMAWTHLMSPEIATRALELWVDLVPMNKVFGFGGDYNVVEKVWGHLLLARQDIARALSGKVERDGMPLPRAEAWVKALLWDNPREVYRLEV